MKLNDLYNNFKIVEQRLKQSGRLSTSSGNMALLSSSIVNKSDDDDSDEDDCTASVAVTTTSSNAFTTSAQKKIDGLGDPTYYAFISTQSSRSLLTHEDLEQVDDDDMEEMDIKWQVALLSMRAKKFWQRTGRQITINGNETAGFDKKKVECFNCHKLG